MGVDTKAIIRKGTTIEQITDSLSKKYDVLSVESTHDDKFFFINLNDGISNRSMAVSFNNTCERDDGIAGVWCSLGCRDNAVEVMKHLCETFGGYIDENDCDDVPFYPINIEEYLKGSELTKLDELKNKIISKLGYENLNKALELFEEYKNI